MDEILPAINLNKVEHNRPGNVYPAGSMLGYIRGIIGNIVLKILVDSGNLGRNIISKEIADSAGLTILKNDLNVRLQTATGTAIPIIGCTKFALKIENIPEPLILDALVCQGVENLNLGNKFLQEYSCKLNFGQTAKLQIGNNSTILRPRDFYLNENSSDKTFELISSKLKRIPPNLLFIDLGKLEGRLAQDYHERNDEVKAGVRAVKAVHLPPQLVTDVVVEVRGVEMRKISSVYFTPKNNNSQLNHRSILCLPGVYHCKDGKFLLKVVNLSDKSYTLNDKLRLGWGNPLTNLCHNIHQIEPRKKRESAEDRQKFIFDSLKLENNELLSEQQKEEVIAMFIDNWDAISEGDFDIGKSSLLKFKIKVVEGAQPVRARLRPLNPDQQRDLKRQLDEWLSAGVIEPSDSCWSSALVPVIKKRPPGESAVGKPPIFRWAVDFRPVNKVTIRDSFPLPLLAQNLERLGGAKIFSSLDARAAYHAIEIEPESRHFTAFVTPDGLWQFCRMPFGLMNSPAIFCRLVSITLDRLPPGIALGYLDDILVMAGSVHEHMKNLRLVLELHSEIGLKLNLSKCSIFQRKVEYLGHVVGEDGVSMVDNFIQRVQVWPEPRTGAEVRSFLGFTGYYRSFIPEYTKLTACLNKLRSESGKIILSKEQRDSLEKLKLAFKDKRLRAYPDFSAGCTFILITDWSKVGVGAVLKQIQSDGEERFIACASWSNNKHEQNYPAHKGELQALIYACKKFEHLLSYRPFILRTDSTFLDQLNAAKDLSGIMYRWLSYLSRFDILVEYTRGELNQADSLSRVEWPAGLEGSRESFEGDGLEGTVNRLDFVNLKPRKDLVLAQMTDLSIQRVKQMLTNEVDIKKVKEQEMNETVVQYFCVLNKLTIENNLLCMVTREDNKDLPVVRVCVPNKMITKILHVSHQGHAGIGETYRRVKEKFYWPYQRLHVEQYVMSCYVCSGKMSFSKRPKYFFKEIIGRPNLKVAIDFVGPLKTGIFNGKRVKYILTVIDIFSRYLVAKPTVGCTTEDALGVFLEHWVNIYGVPNYLHSDRGTHFTSYLFTEVCKALGINKSVTLGYNPTGNSTLERVHGSLKPTLRGLEYQDWVRHLSNRVFYYNISVHNSTHFTPFELFFGRLPNVPIDLFFDKVKPTSTSGFEYLRDLEGKINFKSQQIIDKETKLRFKYLARKPNFVVGNKVWYHRPSMSKLDRTWHGPFTVTKVVNDSVVEISDGKGNSLQVLIYKIKHYVGRDDFLKTLPPEVQNISDDEDDIGGIISKPEGGKDVTENESDESEIENERVDLPVSDSGEDEFYSLTGSEPDEAEKEDESVEESISDLGVEMEGDEKHLDHIPTPEPKADLLDFGGESQQTVRRSTRDASLAADRRIRELYDQRLVKVSDIQHMVKK